MFEGMDPIVILLIFSVIILVVSILGAYLPNVKQMDSAKTHLLVALSAGIFLGILFFTLLPDTMDAAHEALHDGASEEIFMHAGIYIMLGFLAVLFVDVMLKHFHVGSCPCEHDHDELHGHELTSWTAFAGLAIHAAIDGMILAIAIWAGNDVGLGVLIGLSVHKFVELFSLSSVFTLTGREKRKNLLYLFLFSVITPVAAFVSWPVIDMLSGISLLMPLAIATGTFMYVGIYSLLREAFHERRDSLLPFALVVIGIAVMAVISLLLGHGHVH